MFGGPATPRTSAGERTETESASSDEAFDTQTPLLEQGARESFVISEEVANLVSQRYRVAMRPIEALQLQLARYPTGALNACVPLACLFGQPDAAAIQALTSVTCRGMVISMETRADDNACMRLV